MSKNILIQPAYFAPIAQYAAVLQSETTTLEVHDNFIKQTYRTRCAIYAANGKLILNVPVNKVKGIKILTSNTEINYAEDWQKQHFRSLQSAYRSSPFYEYYEDDLRTIFEVKHKNLKELHAKCHNFVMDALQEEKNLLISDEYQFKPNKLDFRDWINVKKNKKISFPKYIQMFDERHGFIPNLSILDLIFMEGPSATIYLENLNNVYA